MITLTERSVSSKADYQRIADFLNLCEAATYREYFFTAEELAHDATSPDFDPERDRRLWENATGELVGIASLWGSKEPIDGILDGHLSLRVHPGMKNEKRKMKNENPSSSLVVLHFSLFPLRSSLFFLPTLHRPKQCYYRTALTLPLPDAVSV